MAVNDFAIAGGPGADTASGVIDHHVELDLREGVDTLAVLYAKTSTDPADARLRELLAGVGVPQPHGPVP